MSVRNLQHLFAPASVAVIGASVRPTSVGAVVMKNLLAGGFAGAVLPVNPKYQAVAGVLAYPDVAALPLAPDLGVICTPPATVPGIVAGLGERGTRAAIVLTAGLAHQHDADGQTLEQAALAAAGRHGLRLLGPNCVGLLSPHAGLNASFAHAAARPGGIAFVSQSGALCTAVLDWAMSYGIGFSHFVSMGDMADIDFGDVLDYLGSDPATRAILMYVEGVTNPRKFLSAARAAARNKHVLAIKSGREDEGARAASSHTGALAGSDDVYDAAFRRAGMLRVYQIEELFAAVQTLARARPLRGDGLAILTNGGGPGVLATDALVAGGGRLAELSDKTLERLDRVLPRTWSRGNPVDIIGDAPPERYADALEILMQDDDVASVLVMNVPTAISSSLDAARAIAAAAASGRPQVLTTWLGRESAAAAREVLADAGLPTYDTPEQAILGYLHLVDYARNQDELRQVPASIPDDFDADRSVCRGVIEQALAEEREWLNEVETKQVLAAYGVPVVPTWLAVDVEQAVTAAEDIGFPVAIKVVSPQIVHKSDVGGVMLDLADAAAVRAAASSIAARVAAFDPEAELTGFAVQPMARRPGAHELIVGATTDPLFGPVVLFGQGGTSVEVVADKAVALPPLNAALARQLIDRTRVVRLLRGYRDRPAADLDGVARSLCQVAQLVSDHAEIADVEINPLWADADGVLALDARLKVRPSNRSAAARLAIRPYPRELEETVEMESGERVRLRPIRPEDEPAHHDFLSRLAPDDIRFRFFGLVRQMAHSEMARYTQIDYDREMAFIAEWAEDDDGTLGVVRTVTDPDNTSAEFAIIVRSDLKGRGLGRLLLEKMIRYSSGRGTRRIVGQVLRDNGAMLSLAGSLGFALGAGDDAVEVSLELGSAT